jgi:hypothetical protein
MASWYDSAYLYRIPISVDNSGGGTGTYSFVLTIPTDLDNFWDNVQADGDDIIITEPDGFTPIGAGNATALEIDNGSGSTFSGGSRLGRIRLDKYTSGTAGSSCFLWMYYGNAAATSDNAFGSWSTPTTVTARITREGGQRVSPKILTRPEAPGATVPRVQWAKVSTETLFAYWDFSSELNQRDQPYEGVLWYEGIASAILSAETGGANSTAVVTVTRVQMMGTRGAVIRTEHPAGTSGTDYTIKLKVTTTLGRVFDRRFRLAVFDTVE